MVMPSLDYFDGSCSSADPLTSPALSSATTDTTFFSEVELAQIEDLDIASMMTPIIKEELKNTIFKRLKETGKDIPQVEMDTSPQEQLSSEDEGRRLMRRLRNKEAAQKCRGKKKEKSDQLEQEVKRLEDKQEDLKAGVESLMLEKEALQDVLDAHSLFCRRGRCEMNEVQFYSNNDHTYTLLDGPVEDSNLVPSLSDNEME